jgi:hypothetical protein
MVSDKKPDKDVKATRVTCDTVEIMVGFKIEGTIGVAKKRWYEHCHKKLKQEVT